MLPTKLLRAWSKVTYLHRIESMLEFWLHAMFCQPFSKIFKRRWSEISSLHLKMLVSDINCLIHVKMLENDAEIFEVKKAAKTCWQAPKFFSLSQLHPLFMLVPVPALDYTISMIVNNACESYNQPKKWAMNSQTNGRKQKRYNTFRATYNLFRSDILLGVIWKRFPAMFRMITHLVWVTSQYQQTSTWQPISRDACASRVNKMAIIFMKCMKTILYSLQIKVTVQWKTRIYKPRKSGRLMASSNILKRYWFAALVF